MKKQEKKKKRKAKKTEEKEGKTRGDPVVYLKN